MKGKRTRCPHCKRPVKLINGKVPKHADPRFTEPRAGRATKQMRCPASGIPYETVRKMEIF